MATYQERVKAAAAALKAQSAAVDYSTMDFGDVGGGEQSGPMSFLNTAFDLISRPLYAVTNTAKEVAEAVTPGAAAADEDTSPLAQLRDIVTAPVRGLFSTQDRDHNYTSQLIEYITDRSNKERDPNYVDEQDNVNPWVKGMAGFVGDVGLDPLTYIPGGAVLKGLKAAKQGVGAGVDAAKELAPAARAAKAAQRDEIEADLNAFDPSSYSPSQAVLDDLRESAAAKPQPRPEPPAPAAAPLVDEAPTLASPARPDAAALRDAFGAFETQPIEGIGKVTARQAQDAFLKVGANGTKGKPTARQEAIFNHVVESMTKAAPKVDDLAPSPAALADDVVPPAVAADELPPAPLEGKAFFDDLSGKLVPAVKAQATASKAVGKPGLKGFLTGLSSAARAGSVGATKAEVTATNIAGLSKWFEGRKGLAAGDGVFHLDRALPEYDGATGRQVLAGMRGIDPARLPDKLRMSDLRDMQVTDPELAQFVGWQLMRLPGFQRTMTPKMAAHTKATNADLLASRQQLAKGFKATSPLEAFAVASNQAEAQRLLGKDLTEWLAKQSPAKFDSSRKHLAEALSPNADLAKWAALRADKGDIQVFSNLLKHLGIAPARSDMIGAIRRVREIELETVAEGRLAVTGEIAARSWWPNFTNAKNHYGTKVKPGVRRTGPDPKKDVARQMNSANASMNYDFIRQVNAAFWGGKVKGRFVKPWAAAETLRVANLLKPVGAPLITDTKKIYGSLRAEVDAHLKAQVFRDLDEINDGLGVRSFITQAGKGDEHKFSEVFGLSGKPIALSLSDIYGIPHELAKEMGMGGMTLRNLFGAKSAVSPTAYQGAWARLIEMGEDVDVQEIARLLGSTHATRAGAQDVPNHFAGKKIPDLDFHPVLPSQRAAQKAKFRNNPDIVWNEAGTGWRRMADGEAERLKMAEFMARPEVLGAVKTRLAQNAQAYTARVGKETHKLSTDQLEAIDAFVTGGSRGAAYEAIAKTRTDLRRRAVEEGMIPDSGVLGADLVEGTVGDAVLSAAQAGVKAVNAVDATGAAATPATLARDTADVAADAARTAQAAQLDDAAAQGIGRAAENAVKAQKKLDRVDSEATTYDDMLEAEIQAEFGAAKDALHLDEMGKRAAQEKHTGETMVLAFGSHQRVQDGVSQRLGGGLRQLFIQSHGMETLNPVRAAWENASGYFVSRQHRAIDALAKKYPFKQAGMNESIWPAVWEGFRTSTRPSDQIAGAAYDEFAEIMGKVLPISKGEHMLDNVVLANGDTALLERLMRENGLDDIVKGSDNGYFDVDLAKAVAKAEGIPLSQALAKQWRSWEVTNPLDFAKRYSNVVATATEWRQMAAQFVQDGRKLGWTSDEARPGFVRAEPSSGTAYGAFIDPTVYYAEPMLRELMVADKFATMPKMVQARIVRDYYIPLLRMWKFDITQLRPGHHIRNFIGDSSITYVARGSKDYLRSGQEAISVLHAHRDYRGVDALGTLTAAGVTKTPKGTDVIVKTAGGTEFTVDEIYEAAMKHGLLPSVYIGEDLMLEGGKIENKFATVVDKISLRGSTVGKKVGDWSEARDHFARMHHFIQALHQDARTSKLGKEELLTQLAKEVRKYHPDASMLTNFETKYMRLIIPFYSWFRGILPAIAESSLRYPGRVMQFPKASFNLAVGNGMNPESLAQPYAEEDAGNYPSFITEQALGPQARADGGEAVALNPGFAHMDVFNLLGTDPMRGVLGMLSPFIRIPAELSTGGMMSTGGRIQDLSDYVDASIPGVNYVANVTGMSPTGSLAGMFTGGGLDPQAQVAKGSKTPLDQMFAAVNWGTGLGMQNLSRESYQRYAQIEERNRSE